MTRQADEPTSSRTTATAGVRFRVEGRVQGVGFRWWTRQLARDLGLVGSVRNRDDGSVELVAAGPPASLARLRSALQHGPEAASVTRIVEAPVAEVDAADFEILR